MHEQSQAASQIDTAWVVFEIRASGSRFALELFPIESEVKGDCH